ncbi:MAG: AraC family ligand binding domain-containing protein, partial [Nannocystaceae bacterium]|nr:AraC family ligand binding domain-containing protein [Nannocystaceae bacterium]
MSPPRQSDPDLEQNLVVRSLAMRLPGGTRIGAHDHTWPQLVYATHGVVTVSTAHGAWVVPPQRAVWVPPHTEHTIETIGTVVMRTLYLRPGEASARPGPCCVLHVTPLLRELVLEIVRVGMLDLRVPAQLHLADVLRDQLGG